jgi:hypothetical protein
LRNTQVHSLRRSLAPLVGLPLLLAGCAGLQKHPAVAQTPSAPIFVPCVRAGEIPAEPPMVGSKFNGDAKHDLQILAPNAKALRDWGQQMHAMLQACAVKTAPPPAVPAAK